MVLTNTTLQVLTKTKKFFFVQTDKICTFLFPGFSASFRSPFLVTFTYSVTIFFISEAPFRFYPNFYSAVYPEHANKQSLNILINPNCSHAFFSKKVNSMCCFYYKYVKATKKYLSVDNSMIKVNKKKMYSYGYSGTS